MQQSQSTGLISNNPLSASPFSQQAVAKPPVQVTNFPVISAATWNVPSPDNSFSQANGRPGTSSAVSPQGSPSKWPGLFNRGSRSPQQQRQILTAGSSGALVTSPMLPSIDEDNRPGLAHDGSSDLDASTAAAAANQQWARTASSPRGSSSTAQSEPQPSSSGQYQAPSPWSTPAKSAPSASASSPASPYVGPFEAAARARAAQSQGQSPDLEQTVPDPGAQAPGIQSAAPSRSTSRSSSGRSGYAVPSPGWTTGIGGMSQTRAARPSRRQ